MNPYIKIRIYNFEDKYMFTIKGKHNYNSFIKEIKENTKNFNGEVFKKSSTKLLFEPIDKLPTNLQYAYIDAEKKSKNTNY